MQELTAPRNLNGGELEDIYRHCREDFDEPQPLEVEYADGRGGRVCEMVFVDPVHAESRPRICVSAQGIQAMHNVIS
eukprot:15076929-Heterocapsa_arctica.AAC.1